MAAETLTNPSAGNGNIEVLRPLAHKFPSAAAVISEIARLTAVVTLPKGTVHVISDIHGDDVKLRHVINNASGTLRPLVEQQLAGKMTARELQEFITLMLYPRETLECLEPALQSPTARAAFCKRTLNHLFQLVRFLARRYTVRHVSRLFPEEYSEMFRELVYGPAEERQGVYFEALTDSLIRSNGAFRVIRQTVRLVRNLAIDELIIAGDCWDRGPRGDRVVEYLRRQPNVSFIWGNHDVAWLGACLGHEALISHVLRISLRYRRLSQLEEGYGITLQPLENLVRQVYSDDPATCFLPRGVGLREPLVMARMQKAAAIMQFKLEGQVIERNPQFNMEHRRLLHRMRLAEGSIEIDGQPRKLRDTLFPTLDLARPYELSTEERACLDRIRHSFINSEKLWEQMQFLVEHGSMFVNRDDNLIFHGCVPVDARGEFVPLEIDGRPLSGRALFEAVEAVIPRAVEQSSQLDQDLLWYLWCGARSPLFGKDRIVTLEKDLVADPATHVETKNPYFELIHQATFCDRVLSEFGADPNRGLIVNGHVPVKVEAGESPLKASGKAITIDGAFSAAYGDHGFTLVLEPNQTFLAKHHHFESVEAAVRDGVDIIPTRTVVRRWNTPRMVAETERGREIRNQVEIFERLLAAYRQNRIKPRTIVEPLS